MTRTLNPLAEVLRLIDLQHQLRAAFLEQFPRALDSQWLIGIARDGSLNIESGEAWRFLKHGRGVRFTRDSVAPALVVDMHDGLADPDVVDSWRLTKFLESGSDEAHKASEVDQLLDDLAKEGRLEKLPTGSYQNAVRRVE